MCTGRMMREVHDKEGEGVRRVISLPLLRLLRDDVG